MADGKGGKTAQFLDSLKLQDTPRVDKPRVEGLLCLSTVWFPYSDLIRYYGNYHVLGEQLLRSRHSPTILPFTLSSRSYTFDKLAVDAWYRRYVD